jgi:hypothetical protein
LASSHAAIADANIPSYTLPVDLGEEKVRVGEGEEVVEKMHQSSFNIHIQQ